jgi:MoaA/NifB/PqqE/SkfB family radical SAM enzyme
MTGSALPIAGRSRPAIDAPDTNEPTAPMVRLDHLDALWFQVAGTICNLRCTHCFISCAPENHSFWFLSLDDVLGCLEESKRWGVKEYYVTGGEPFMHVDLPRMLEAMLELGPATVLTNGTLLPDRALRPIAEASERSPYSLELRVSIDGPSPELNDPVRGEGTFDRAMDGVRRLLDYGFLPIITATQVWDPDRDEEVRRAFVRRLQALGYSNPRLKVLPSLRIGREIARDRGYTAEERITEEMMCGFDTGQLLCSSSRIVTSRGVHVCPILIDAPESRLGDSIGDAERPFELSHQACYTCWLYGAICSNYGVIGQDVT